MNRWFALVLAAVLFVAAPARAYVPPSAFIIREIAKKRIGLKRLVITTQVVALGDGGATFRNETILDAKAGTLESRALNEAGQELYWIQRKIGEEYVAPSGEYQAGRDWSAHAVAPKSLGGAPAVYVFFGANPFFIARALMDAGVPVKTEPDLLALKTEDERRAAEVGRLSRWNGEVFWVIGQPGGPAGGGRSAATPQLWIAKDAFIPRKLVHRVPGRADEWVEIQSADSRQNQGFTWPTTVTVTKAGTLHLKEDLVAVSVAPALAKTRVADRAEAKADGLQPAGNLSGSDLKDLLRDYYLFLR